MSSNGDMRMMCTSAWVVGVMLAAGAAWTGAGAQQQVQSQTGGCTFTDDSGKSVFWPNCKDPAKTAAATPSAPGVPNAPGAASVPGATNAPGVAPANPGSPQKFPFPGEAPAAPAQQTSAQPGDRKVAPADGAGTKRFPFPGEEPAEGKPAQGATPANPDGMKDAGSSGSSSSSSSDPDSSSSSSSSDRDGSGTMDGDDDAAAKAAAARHKKRMEPTVREQTSDQRVQEDLSVAGFYQNDGNFRGAYARAKDAVSLADDDANAHLALADAARKLGKLDEAETNYKKALTLDPIPKTKKAAEKALKEMSGGS